MEKDIKKTQTTPNAKVKELPVSCSAHGCKKKIERVSFCNEHFLWFKAGLVKKDGSFPKDFDKKYIQYIRKTG